MMQSGLTFQRPNENTPDTRHITLRRSLYNRLHVLAAENHMDVQTVMERLLDLVAAMQMRTDEHSLENIVRFLDAYDTNNRNQPMIGYSLRAEK